MPIYAYRCTDCGHAKDVLQKVSDPLLTVCPACGASTFTKQLTAAGFQLKGSGWYATDFRNGGAGKPADAAAAPKGDDKAAPVSAPASAPASAPSAVPASDGGSTSAGSGATASGGCGSSCACH